jgi:alpha-tubulin suppressor-like RCC1 family protein
MNTKPDSSNRPLKAPNKRRPARPIIITQIGLVAFLAAGIGFTALAQSFYNLDFEEASLIPVSGGYAGEVLIGPALPGWSVFIQEPFVLYDNMFLDSAGVSIFDTLMGTEAFQGNFTVILQGGFSLYWGPGPPDRLASAIAQTGLIPAWAKTLLFDARVMEPAYFTVSLGPFCVLASYTNYNLYAVDVSGLSGQTVGLEFVALPRPPPGLAINNVYLDDIRFSSSPLAAPPFILTPPRSQTVDPGSTVEFTVFATGFPPPAFQWFFNGTNRIAGATSPVLELPNAVSSQSGAYTVVVTNVFGAVTSSPAILAVVGIPPSIWMAPLSQTVNVGEPASFTVGARGTPPLGYQWCFQGKAIEGANATELNIVNAQLSQNGAYTVVVTNAFGAVTSSPALLTVVASPPSLLTSPRSQTDFVGWSLDFMASARGSLPLTYLWFLNDRALSGASGTTVHLANLQLSDSGTYTVVVTNAFGAATSAPAILKVIARPPHPPAGTVVAWGDVEMPYVAPGTRFATIAAGSLHSLAIKSDGTVVAWGNDSGGQSAVPAGLSNVIAIAGGGYGLPSHSLALKSDGTIVAWGDNYNGGQGTVPLGLSGVIGVSAGSQHNLALKSDGTAFAWGDNTRGQTNIPVGLGGVVAIAAGGYHNLALKSDGTVVAWGANSSDMPAGLNGVIAVAAGYLHSLALKSDGTVVAWGGGNSSGEISVPTGLKGVTAIAAKGYHSLALKSDGTVVPWGENSYGEADVPAGLSNVIAIAAGEEHSLALKSDGTVVAWGGNDYSQTMVPGTLAGVIALASGGWMSGHHLALKADGTVVAWGRISCQFASPAPTNLSGVTSLAVGECHGLALKYDGTVVGWGDSSDGGTVPGGLSNVLAVGAGGWHSLAVRSDHTVVAWGSDRDEADNFAGQSTVPPALSGVTAVAGGEFHSLALKSDGTVVAWGSNNDYSGQYAGQSVVPAGLSGVLAIAAGGFHSLALKSDGTVVAWGNDTFGQIEVPVGLNGVVGIAAGQYHSLALKSDGTIVAWGESTSGTVPVGLSRVINVVAAGLRSLALVAEPPILLTPPATQTAEIGSTVGFHVQATGTMPLSYEWIFNSTIATTGSTTNCGLLLTNIQPSQAGAYTVVVTNIAGAVTSSPAMLNVIAAVERRPVPGVKVTGEAGSLLNVDSADSLSPAPDWTTLSSVSLTSTSQYYFDLALPLPPQRLYRAWQTGTPGVIPSLDLHMVPAITLTGSIGSSLRLDYINQFGPTDAWVTLATVTLTNTSQLYFDVSAPGQPQRLYRLTQVP